MSIQLMYFISKKFFFLLIYLLLFSACSLTPLPQQTANEVYNSTRELSIMLQELNVTVDQREANNLAKEAIFYARRLSKKYELVSPPLWHNTLINIGIKKRGLCYEWAEDLLAYLHKKRYQSLIFHYVGANIGNYFEHNAIAVSAKGMGFENGILLDAWRGSGNLFFVKIKEDEKYEWHSRKGVYRLMFPHLKRWGKLY